MFQFIPTIYKYSYYITLGKLSLDNIGVLCNLYLHIHSGVVKLSNNGLNREKAGPAVMFKKW